MTPGNALAGRVRAALERTVHVEEKRMFGGIVFMVHGKIVSLVMIRRASGRRH